MLINYPDDYVRQSPSTKCPIPSCKLCRALLQQLACVFLTLAHVWDFLFCFCCFFLLFFLLFFGFILETVLTDIARCVAPSKTGKQEKFCKLRDLNAQNIVVSNNPCASCQKTTHTILSCPYIQYIPQKMFLISKYNFSQTQDRGKKTRARKQHYNTYQNAKTQRIQLRHLREKLVSEIIMNDEEAYQELVELFHLNYQENSDQEFILNTPGIIKNDKEEYVIKEDDSFLEEEYYLDYLKEQEKNLFSLPDQMQSGNVESNLLQEIDEVTDPVKEKEHAKITSLEQALLVQEEDIKSKNESHMSVQINVSNENCDLSSKKEDKVLLKQGSNCSVSKQGGDQQQQPQP